MTEIAIIYQPQWRVFQHDWIHLGEIREFIHDAYFNEAIVSIVPETELILEDDNLYFEVYCRLLNIMTFGEYVEQMNEEEEKEYLDNEFGYGEDIKHDIEALLTFDCLFYQDSMFGNYVNAPVVTIF